MTSEGNGQFVFYRIDISGKVRQEIKALIREAAEQGLEEQAWTALQIILQRLHADPWQFGELTRRRKHLRLQEHIGFVNPLRVHFAIHEELPFVVVMKVVLVII